MATSNAPYIVLGLANVGNTTKDPMARYGTPETVKELLDTFHKRGYNHLDTARNYPPHAPGTGEPLLGAVFEEYGPENNSFITSTKIPSWGDHPHSPTKIAENVNASLTALKMPQVDVEYLHEPDRTVPYEETCEAMDKAYKEGKFRRFGLSNYSTEEVEKIVAICEEHGFVKPTVYQGQYNAVARNVEEQLIPVLRKHGMAFYAYSPAAGGMFSGNHKRIGERGGRYDTTLPIGQLYSRWYLKPSIIAAVDKAIEAATKSGISGHEASLRWVAYHSALDRKLGDGIVMGASSIKQLEQNLDIFEQGPLPQEVAEAYSACYSELGDDKVPYSVE